MVRKWGWYLLGFCWRDEKFPLLYGGVRGDDRLIEIDLMITALIR